MNILRRLAPVIGFALLAAGLPASAAHSGQTRPPLQAPTGTPQQPAQPPPPSTGVLLGQIVDVSTGRAVPGAIVNLAVPVPPRPPLAPGQALSQAEIAAIQAASTPRRILTDSSGMFAFNSLPKGSFRLSVEATGYLSGTFGQTRVNGPGKQLDLDQAEHRTGIVIKLWPYGSIAGTVLDESGDPAVGLQMRLLRLTSTNGQRRLSPNQSVQTDDRGAYRFSQLTPGEYLVALPQTVTSVPAAMVDAYMVASRNGNGAADLQRDLQASGAPMPFSSGVRLGDQDFMMQGGMNRPIAPPTAGENGKTFAYQTIFYPSATTSADASTVSIASGQERSGIDLQLRMTQTVKVSGTVTGPDGPAGNMGVKLLPAAQDLSLDNGFETATTATDAFGGFTFPAVPTGAYTLRVIKVPRPAPPPPPPPPPPPSAAGGGRGNQTLTPLPQPLPTDPVLWAESSVAVADTDVTGLSVTLRTGSRISGRIAFDGAATPPTPDMLQRMSISVSTADGRPNLVSNVGSPGRVSAMGQFTTVGFPPGKYTLSAGGNLPGWYYKGATLGGRNLDEDPIEISGTDISGVTVTFTDRVTQISGTVHDPTVTRDMTALVMFFPADYAAWLDHGGGGRRTRNTTVGGSGAFMISGLAAGDYLAVAVNPDTISDVRDKAFYDSLARVAQRISLSDGEKKSIDLTVSTIR